MTQLTSVQLKHLTLLKLIHQANQATLKGNTDTRIDRLIEQVELELSLTTPGAH